MWSENKRLFVLIGLLVVVVCTYVVLHGLPWSSSDDESDLSGPGDTGSVAAANTDDPPDARRPSARTSVGAHAVSKTDGTGSLSATGDLKVAAVRRKVARIAERPKPEHLDQLNFYMVGLGVGSGQVDYLDKSALLTGETPIDLSFRVEADEERFNALVERAETLSKVISRKEPPQANSCWLCDYCQHHEECSECD